MTAKNRVANRHAKARPLSLAFFAVATMAAHVGCTTQSTSGTSTAATSTASSRTKIVGLASLSPEQANKVLATVGTKNITLGDFVATLERMDQFDRLRYQSAERRKELLDELINIELLAQEAERKGYDKDPIAQEERRQILKDAYLAKVRETSIKPGDVPEAEVRAYFDAHKADYRDPERRRVSAILVRDERTANAVQKEVDAATTATAWGELVRAQSIDPAAKANVPLDLLGDLGMVSPPGDKNGENARIPEPVRVALFQLEKVSDSSKKPIKVAGDRFYLIRYVGRSEPRERTYAEAERFIRVKLAQEKMKARETAELEALKKEFPVTIDESKLGLVRVPALPSATAPTPSSAKP
jgi:peptidyl-prolyl cis-trans isomerase C